MYDMEFSSFFWSKVFVSGSKTHCWMWRKSTEYTVYGKFRYKNKPYLSHRVAWEMFNGEPLGERHALHRCHEPRCCNPHHIYAGTPADNARDRKLLEMTPHIRGSVRMRSKGRLNGALVIDIRERILSGDRICDIANDFDLPYTTVHTLKSDRTWKDYWPLKQRRVRDGYL